jgi:serine phosphatase RsbU (regulator of sigma subunit)
MRTRGRPGAPGHRARRPAGAATQPRGPAGAVASRPPAARVAPPADAHGRVKRAVDDAIDAIPLPVPLAVKALIVALALLAVLLAAYALLVRRRAWRLAAHRAALLEDVGLLQQALLPVVPERLGALRASVAYRPASGPGAGGDFYDAFALPDGRVGIVVGDVCGHGRGALGRTAAVHYALRAYLEAGLEPCAALRTAGQVLDTTDAEPTTVVVAVYDPAQGSLTYAAAGHPPPVLVATPAHEPITAAASPPLGAGVPTGRRQTTVPLTAGALACFFTDGLIEARIGPAHLGLDGVAAIVRHLHPHEDAEALLTRVAARADTVPDDMAACIIRAEADPGRPGARVEELEVDAAGARHPALASFLAHCELDDNARAAVLHRAQTTATEFGAARIRVLLGGHRRRVTVTPAPTDPAADSWSRASATAPGP